MQDQMISQNIIITERCRSLRQLGRNALRGKWKNAMIAVGLFLIIIQLPQLIFDKLFGTNMGSVFTQNGFTYNMDVESYQQMMNAMPQSSPLSGIWAMLITGPMLLGIMIYFLAAFRGHNVVPKDVFLGFERFGKAFGLLLFQALFIFLWSLLFIVPGIIAAIRYSQAFYVLADDPNKSIRECMDESKFMMKGNKGKYFLLSLSFIGWCILAGVPNGFLQSIVSTMGAGPVVSIITAMIGTLFLTPVYAYIYSTFAGFYEILAGHLIKETEPMPVTPDQIDVNAPVAKIEEAIEAVAANEAPASEADPKAGQSPQALPEADPNAGGFPEATAGDISEADTADAADPGILPEPLDEEDKYND